ncbi:MAG: hypothetical protein H6R14_36 [Proteobacteria bacterium]|nr:hypothetical protein [Pseudomonadota bacterium]
MSEPDENLYQCVGICMADPDSGYCLGCGRPPLTEPGIVAELVVPTPTGDAGNKTEQAE